MLVFFSGAIVTMLFDYVDPRKYKDIDAQQGRGQCKHEEKPIVALHYSGTMVIESLNAVVAD
ncbi:hypothetical protein Scep_013791 [Stephania cephalantha]|uniref:Uncharacterized protein n=1 Tax=Stephania cephalantha TaxID=152367 RepID=A0AAP0P123_9MAGN